MDMILELLPFFFADKTFVFIGQFGRGDF